MPEVSRGPNPGKKGNGKNRPWGTTPFSFEKILSSRGDHISIIDRGLNILWANETVCSHFGREVAGKKCYAAYQNADGPCPIASCPVQRTLKTGHHHKNEKFCQAPNGKEAFYSISVDVVERDGAGRPQAVIQVARDITALKRTEEELARLNAGLEGEVHTRTKALTVMVKNLREAIDDHNATLERLEGHKLELERRGRDLEDANTALRVLLANRDAEKSAYETEVASNIIKGVLPYLDGLKKSGLTGRQNSFVSLIEANLDTVFSAAGIPGFVGYSKLTPAELQVAYFIRQGKSTKEIAHLLNISPRTVESHRDHIRKKIGIRSKGVSLRKALLSQA